MADSLIYGLEFQARALAPQAAETDKTSFFIGTQSLKFANNQVHLIQLNDDDCSLRAKVYRHKDGEIWSLSSSTNDKNVLSTCYSLIDETGSYITKSTLWKLPEEEDNDLQVLCQLDTEKYGTENQVSIFHPNDGNQLATVVDNKVVIWNIGDGQCQLTTVVTMEGKGQPKFTTGRWNPTVGSQFATANDCSIKGWDIRTPSKYVWTIENAHLQLIRDLDFNPNRHYYVATCGDDGRSRFWDFRYPTQALVTRSDHSHWVWSIKYNHYHDELVATASSDTRVLIARVPSIASSSTVLADEVTKEKLSDGVVATFEQHEDSAYCVEWSAADPWILASLSYDGRLLVNQVPKEEKYKILL